MIEIIKQISIAIPWAIGVLTILYWFKTPKPPSDDSNRINNIVSWWIGLTRPYVMAHAYNFFRQDVMKNIEDVEKVVDNEDKNN